MFRISAFLRLLGSLLLVAYFVIAALWLGTRYWVLPNIDQWRPAIARQLSAALDTPVKLGRVEAAWVGLNLRLGLTDVDILDTVHHAVLSIPRVRAVLSWRSILNGIPQFASLEADGLELTLRQNQGKKLLVLGRAFALDTPNAPDRPINDSAITWLASQPLLVLRGAVIRWQDDLRGAPPLVLRQVALKARNDGSEHSFSLKAVLPDSVGHAIELRGHFSAPGSAAQPVPAFTHWDGQLYLALDKLSPAAWKPWVDIPLELPSGQMSGQAWLQFAQGRATQLTADAKVHDIQWVAGADARFDAAAARLYMTGPEQAFRHLVQDPAFRSGLVGPPTAAPLVDPPPASTWGDIQFQLIADDVHAQAPDVFKYPFDFPRITIDGALTPQDNHALRLSVQRAHLLNRDVDARLAGTWQQGGSGAAGIIDMRGAFSYAEIRAIDDYLPNFVSVEARDWMADGLVHGQVRDARLVLKGDLEHFPFAQRPEQGDFRIWGDYTDGTIDYLPVDGNEPGWPPLTGISGKLAIERADLRIVADRATMWPIAGQPIELKNIRAHIPDLEGTSILTIQGDTDADAAAYLALLRHSPLSDMLDKVFDSTEAKGSWQVPLRLTIPLQDTRDTRVQGRVGFNGGSVTFVPEMPPFSKITGSLDFSDAGAGASNLKAVFLGGNVAFSGALDDKRNSLKMHGYASADALSDYVGLKGMRRLTGKLNYSAALSRQEAGQYTLSADSNLIGLALDLPKPLGKTTEQPLPLRLQWSMQPKNSVALDINVDDKMKAMLLHRRSTDDGPYFHAGTIGVNQSPTLLRTGLNIDIEYPNFDVDAWDDVIDDFSSSTQKHTKDVASLMPDLQRFRLQSKFVQVQGLELDHVTFTAQRPDPMKWRLDVSSSQTAGTLYWQEAHGKVAGSIEARFERLALGRNADTVIAPDVAAAAQTQPQAEMPPLRDYLDIPAIDLKADTLILYGRDVGALLVQGVNQSRGELWKLNKLTLSTPAARMSGSGTWRLSGPDRGLTLDARAEVDDLGKYFDRLGFKDVMTGGSGTLSGTFEWRSLPWTHKKTDLDGRLEIDLKKGRFNSVGSRSARLLELLSLQSIKRLATFKLDPRGLAKEGFPFDFLRGTLLMDNGIVTTDDYRVSGSVGTIVLGGNVNVATEQLDLHAVVVPNLDVSGAAVAAGIAINPIIGIGAFLTQWLLQGPLAKAMTVQYQIDGGWDDPKVTEVAPAGEAKKPLPAALPKALPKKAQTPAQGTGVQGN